VNPSGYKNCSNQQQQLPDRDFVSDDTSSIDNLNFVIKLFQFIFSDKK